MYGTCETLCRELAAKYPGDTPLMLVVWSPEEIQALADGMDISLSDHEIRTVLARLEDIPEDQRIESGISSAAAMEIISNSTISVFCRDGVFRTVYCHLHGEPTWNGRILHTHYATGQQAEALVEHGDIRCLVVVK
ncbi:DUF1380 domain-containing protein [Escherichia coli]|nr:DUF1380 domain-containing protein [Escherichia coli]EEY1523205.1 DUF1380 domain-containing protein [Escherichia coli O126]EFB4150588.1 DUF1380 domain-containing protein [Escherichia coli O128]EFE2157924.1 DUF1380 domain-containing protein [Escherichia coli O8:H8]EYZ91038.1 hypothetical protein BW79_25200 [Escherichia coli O119:H4 str. 03-3458]